MFGMNNYLYIGHVKRVAGVSRSLSICVGSNVDQIHSWEHKLIQIYSLKDFYLILYEAAATFCVIRELEQAFF